MNQTEFLEMVKRMELTPEEIRFAWAIWCEANRVITQKFEDINRFHFDDCIAG